ncbi:MAG: hypothetical protein H7A45_16830 [Verrucomicrobiales bacterium]|nr:hypothetical protein [Verrucomicrobiales bacterium]
MRLGGQLSGDPAVVAWGPDRLDVFARAVDDQLWHNGWGGVRWGGWESLGGVLLGSPAVVSHGPNRLDVFSRHADSALIK